MVLRRRKRADENATTHEIAAGQGSTAYEEFRQRRIKENNERMQKLGIFDLSLNLKSLTATTPKKSPKKPKLPKSLPLSTSLRRSSRLSGNPVNHSILSYYIDAEKGETCHQCRKKTLRLHTHCSSCKAAQGQFCGRCLYTRYGENVIEVKENENWVCPVCRGICNCSRCRKAKGWEPTGYLFRKVSKLGFKSVAHYLIHTQQLKTQPEDTGVEISESEERELSSLNKAEMEELE